MIFRFSGATIYMLLILFLVGCKDNPIFQKGRYSISKKKLVSYYSASPDLYVKTDSGTAKINLNPFYVNHIPQEKIETISLTEVGKDSIYLVFGRSAKNGLPAEADSFGINIKYCVDSILGHKSRN